MKKLNRALILILCAFVFISCTQKKDELSKTDNTKTTENSKTDNIKKDNVMTKEQQQSLTPDKVLQLLKEGNSRFAKGELTPIDISKQITETAKGQYPMAVVLSCLDSRIPVEKVFDLGIGDVFVARVAGNFVNTDILGSMEFGCKVSGAKLILVLGHEDCGAIKAAVDDVKMGNITEMLANIRPAVDSLKSLSGDKTSKNKDFVQKVCDENVKLAVDNIRKKSPILKEMEDKGEIKIVGAVYNLEDGKVGFFDK